MPDPILTVERRPHPGTDAQHILASRTGLEALGHMLEADRAWTGCTKPQRRLLEQWCRPLLARLLAEGHLTAEDMSVVGAQRRTVEALQKRGLVDDKGRLTGRAVHAFYWTHAAERAKAHGGAALSTGAEVAT